MEKCNESRCNALASSPRQTSPKRKIPRSSFYTQSCASGEPEMINQPTDPEPTWLNLSMDAALGCRVNVFQVQLKRYGKRSVDNYVAHSVSIHPQAAPIVVRCVSREPFANGSKRSELTISLILTEKQWIYYSH